MILNGVKFLLAVLASLLPEFYRNRLRFLDTVAMRGPATLSGLLQMLGAFGLVSQGYFAFFFQQLGTPEAGRVLEDGYSTGSNALLSGFGVLYLVAYLLQPSTLLLLYFSFEGFLRALDALVSDQVLPSLPLALVASVHKRLAGIKANRERALAPPDIVLPGDGGEWDLKILSSLPKNDWDSSVTVLCDDTMYRVIGRLQGEASHPYVYLLKKKPAGEVVRGLRRYGN